MIRDGDRIKIDIPARSINVILDEKELDARRKEADQQPNGWKPDRDRKVSTALKAYASMVSSADRGAIRQIKE